MPNIRIVTDSTSDIPDEIARQFDIKIIPLTVNLKGKEVYDRFDITNEEYFKYLKETNDLPVTSQVTPARFVELYRLMAKEGVDTIYSVHISSDLSGTYNSARLAASEVKDIIDVRVVDSRSATMGLGLLVTELAEKIKQTDDLLDLDAFVDAMCNHVKIYFLLNSLDNLEKGGRIGKASYLVGSILNIKPLLLLNDGVIQAYKKIRGNKDNRAINELAKTIIHEVKNKNIKKFIIGYNDCFEYAEQISDILSKELIGIELTYYQLGTVVTTHIGLGAIGVAFIEE